MLRLVDESSAPLFAGDVPLDGLRLGQGRPRPALVLHGVEGLEANRPILHQLANNFDVSAPSHPGFDLSPRPDWCDSVEDLAYLYLEHLEQEDMRDVLLVGFQFGGWVAAEMAVRDSARLSRLVLVDPLGIKVGGPTDRDIADVFAMPRKEVDERMFHDPASAPGPLAEAPEEEVLRISRNEESLALYGWDPYLHNPRLRRWLRRIKIPTLVVWGASDRIVTTDYGRAFAESISGARLAVVPESGHRPQVERPALLGDLITDFAAT